MARGVGFRTYVSILKGFMVCGLGILGESGGIWGLGIHGGWVGHEVARMGLGWA